MSDASTGVPTSGTDVTDKFDAYWRALGHFIHQFALIEAHMQMLLWVETGVSVNVARAIFSGTRIDAAKSYISRCREAHHLPEHALLKRAFAQLSDITSARNDIVHFGARFNGNAFAVTNELLAHIPDRKRSFPVSPEVLHDMIADLNTISAAFSAYMIERQAPVGALQNADLRSVIDAFARGGSAPWRFKPTPAPPVPKRTSERSTGRKRRPKR